MPAQELLGQLIILQTCLLLVFLFLFFLVGFAFNVYQLPSICYTNVSACARERYFAWAEAEGSFWRRGEGRLQLGQTTVLLKSFAVVPAILLMKRPFYLKLFFAL